MVYYTSVGRFLLPFLLWNIPLHPHLTFQSCRYCPRSSVVRLTPTFPCLIGIAFLHFLPFYIHAFSIAVYLCPIIMYSLRTNVFPNLLVLYQPSFGSPSAQASPHLQHGGVATDVVEWLSTVSDAGPVDGAGVAHHYYAQRDHALVCGHGIHTPRGRLLTPTPWARS
ncbi:hypothetical protein BOTBODRAFT_549690 [Botryobasidium botryosum FD-172 SS1]|uniref:Uncharacterized protein n=1 Tax=Botryobasidium botryosum (strain FD-172 SS1) TaxID=930990 RepID=A0A067MR78_BOTB1|nr:hypothetical protein BOTBODRAFT_549690 [Botryobasidium botryosum FD-172 SS1]